MAENKDNKTEALDDLMIAMDVVDTLRHDKKIVDRELNEKNRREGLIQRLREIYHSQGIEVPDHVLEEGVKALEDGRFTYTAPKDSFKVRLAKIYVSRSNWGSKLMIFLSVVVLAWFSWKTFVVKPQEQKAENKRIELTERLPKSFKQLVAAITAEAKDPSIAKRAVVLGNDGEREAKAKNLAKAKAAEKQLQDMLNTLRQEYTIRVVLEKGVLSGVKRIPKVNRRTRNYYLIVEAIDKNGNVLEQEILSEEKNKKSKVKRWGARVPKSVYDAVAADKKDDGIIQNNIVAVKSRGFIKPTPKMRTLGGAITEWERKR